MEFYKFRNGNGRFEYDVTQRLDNIEKSLSNQIDSIVCGVLSSVIAEYITDSIDKLGQITNKYFIFVPILILCYIILKRIIKICKWIYEKNKAPKNDISTKQQKEIIDLFYNKIVNEMVYGISMVNHLQLYLVSNQKIALHFAYALQAKYSFERNASFISSILYNGSVKRRKEIVDLLGKNALEEVMDERFNIRVVIKSGKEN